jgi:hypothetical protein
MGRTEGKYRLTSMQVYQDDKIGRLLSRVERLEAALRGIGENCTIDWVKRLAKKELEADDGEG